MNRKLGTYSIILGVMMLVISIGLAQNNFQTDKKAGEASSLVLEELSVYEINPADERSETDQNSLQIEEVPDYQLRPEMDMPEKEVDEIPYVGTLDIPRLDLKLPVISTTDYSYLRIAPCRLQGSAYLDDLVIGAHNYQTHFGKIKNLGYEDTVIFTDLDGNRFEYMVSTIEILQPEQLDDLCAGEWPLTLYTCTIGGRTRIVVRCEYADRRL